MKEQLILGTTAFLAKTKGCVGLNNTTDYVPMYKLFEGEYISETEKWVDEIRLSEGQGEDDCRENYALAITQGLLQKWLRETHNIQIVVIPFAEDATDDNSQTLYHGIVNKKQFYGWIDDNDNDMFKTYEEALEHCLIEALNLLQDI